MERKITIRRVGTIFPALCLVVIVLMCVIIAWLSIVGLPDSVLRKIEQQAEPYGVTLHLGKIKLAPTAGLAAKALGVQVTLPSADGNIKIKARKCQFTFSIYEMMQGNFLPNALHVLGLEAALPISDSPGKAILLNESDTHLTLFNRGQGLSITSTARIQGIGINFKGSFRLPEKSQRASIGKEASPENAPTRINADEFLRPIQPWLGKIDRQLTQQQWTDEQRPWIDIKLRTGNNRQTAEIKAEAPSFRHDKLHFHNASLSVRYEDQALTIDHLTFATKSPRTEVSLQGAYDFPERRLNFNLRSTAAIAQIVEMVDRSQKGNLLSRIYPDASKSPSVKLRGQIEFSENYALNNIVLRGDVLQRDISIGQTPVDSFALSFMLSDGRFNIDNLSLSLPNGQIKMSALTGRNQADAHLVAEIPTDTLTQLVTDISGKPVELPQHLTLGGKLTLKADALLEVKEFLPGITRLSDLIPSLKEISNLDMGLDSIRYGQINLTEPQLKLTASGLKHPTLSSDILNIQDIYCSLSAKSVDNGGDYSLKDSQFTLQIASLSANCSNPEKTLKVSGTNLDLSIAQAVSGNVSAHNIACHIHNLPEYNCSKTWAEMLSKSDTCINLNSVLLQQRELASEINLSITHPLVSSAEFLLKLNLCGEEVTSALKLNYTETEQNGNLDFEFAESRLPLLACAPLLQQFDALPEDIELPEELILSTKGRINVNTYRLSNTYLYLHTPKLVRTPRTLIVNRGKKIPLNLTLKTTLNSNEQNEILYRGDIAVLHDTGSFRADLEGNLSRHCNISKGHNTIGVDVLDALIDNPDAHGIMRDFRFGKDSRVTVSDISAQVEYDNGISVRSFCKADIRNTDFLIGAIQDITDDSGRIIGEKLRSDMGSNPYSRVFRASCDVLVDVQMSKKNPDGSPAPEKLQIVLQSPYLDYDNRPWLKKQQVSKGTHSSIIRGDSIVFDLNNNGIVLNNLRGKAYPAYAFGMFFSPLHEFMKDIRLQYPVDVNTKRCEFPISKRSQVPISGLIRAESATGAAFDFLGTTIPLQRFSGFINLSDEHVFLDKMNARTWGGVLNGAIKIGISGESTSFDGQLTAQNLDLSLIGKAYKTTLSPALCNANIRFQSPTSEVKDVRAYGKATIRDGNLMELGIFQPVGSLISDLPGQLAALQRKVTGQAPTPAEKDKPGFISRFLSAFTDTTDSAISKVDESSRHIPFANHFMSYNIQNASLDFDILNGYLYTRNMKASGYNLDIDMNLRLDLNTLNIRGNLWPQISSVPTLIIAPITFLSDFLIDIVIYGNIEDIQWKFTLDRIMRKNGRRKKPSVTAAEEKQKR